MFVITIVIVMIIAGIASYYGWFGETERGRQATVMIGNAVFNAEVRDTAAGRAQGLSGRDSLGAQEGMLFLFGTPGDYGFWMKDMNFPIDIVWIREGEVVWITENAEPEPGKSMFSLTSYNPPTSADTVLEINAGEAVKYGIKAGDVVVVQ
jgi:hypothetical protein